MSDLEQKDYVAFISWCHQFKPQLDKIDTQMRFTLEAFPSFEKWGGTSVIDAAQNIVRVSAGMMASIIIEQDKQLTQARETIKKMAEALEVADKNTAKWCSHGNKLKIKAALKLAKLYLERKEK